MSGIKYTTDSVPVTIGDPVLLNRIRELEGETARLRAAGAFVENALNYVRDTMIDDRSHYEGLLDFAVLIERTAAHLRAALAGEEE